MRYIVGIDEAGRGPLAGPVAVGVVKVDSRFNKKFWRGIRDSKKLSEKVREEWFRLAKLEREAGRLDYAVSLVSEKVIDQKGIVYAINLGLKKCLTKLKLDPKQTKVFLDGSLKAPVEFAYQETIIKGDTKVPLISLASILAKVTRDRFVVRLAKKFPGYGLEVHKGYGTKEHLKRLRTLGPSPCHRQSFLGNLTKRR